MRIVIDAMCAQFGGIATYTEHLIATWPDQYPEDELHVLLPESSKWWPLPEQGVIRHDVAVSRPAIIGRPIAQARHVRTIARRVDADAVLATLPSTSLRSVGKPLAVVVYDLRHELRPEQFSPARRMMRKVAYGRGYQLADVIISISRRSLDDLLSLHPKLSGKPCRVVHFGSDHVDSWARGGPTGCAIAFGHHSNKNVNMVLDAWRELTLTEADAEVPRLVLLGLGKQGRERLASALHERGLESHITLAPFLPAAEFEMALTGCSMIVFPTDFEGFGLPVVEALRLRIPIVIGPEPACLEVAGGHATEMTEWSSRALVAAVRRAANTPVDQLNAGQHHTDSITWAATVHGTRAALLDAVGAAVS